MNKVLIVSYYFPPFNGPGAQHPDFFHRYLRDEGFETTVVTSAVYFSPNAAPSAVPAETAGVLHLPRQPRLRSLSLRLYKTEMQVQVRMGRWQPGFVWGKCFALAAAEKLLAQGGIDAMISVSPPVSSHWVALKLKKRFPKVFWIADFQDPFIGNPFDRTNTAREQRFERALFSSADVLSANTDTALQMWTDRYPELANKMTVTWGGYDPEEEVRPLPLASPTPVLSYVGLLFGARVPIKLLESLARLTDNGRLKRNDVMVEFVGDLDFGPAEELSKKLSASGWVRTRATYVPRAEALSIAGRAHYSLLLDIAPGNAILQVPAKLFDQIRIGRPILAFTPDNSPAARILKRSGILYSRASPDDSAENTDQALLDLLAMPTGPKPASAWFHDHFNARALAASLGHKILARA